MESIEKGSFTIERSANCCSPEESRAHEVVLEEVVDPGANRVASQLEPRPPDEKADPVALLEIRRSHGVLVGADHAPELEAACFTLITVDTCPW